MIFISFGANRPSRFGDPENTIRASLPLLRGEAVYITSASSLYLTPPVGPGRQQFYVNAVAAIRTRLPPAALLMALHRVEQTCGRRRKVRWAARTLDLDLIAYNRMVTAHWPGAITGRGDPLVVPHREIEVRSFVVLPFLEVAPGWRHPATGRSVQADWDELETTPNARNIRRICGPEWADLP